MRMSNTGRIHHKEAADIELGKLIGNYDLDEDDDTPSRKAAKVITSVVNRKDGGAPAWLSIVALVSLTLQNAFAVLIMRYCRSVKSESVFLTQTAVIMGEVLKGFLSMLLVLRDHGTLRGVCVNKLELLKSGVPAMLYLLQNNLQYVAVSNLEASTYQVTYQLKILTTGVLSVMFLGKSLTKLKWLALVILTTGVAVVQLSQLQPRDEKNDNVNLPVGLTCTLLATLSSGMASVYFEKMLKDGSPMDVWQRNFQLAIYSVIIGFFGLGATEQGTKVMEGGFFQGYTWITWVNVATQGGGGLLIAMVIKYADSIMKNIATSMSTVVCALMSLVIFENPLNTYFIIGAVLVNYATYLYSK